MGALKRRSTEKRAESEARIKIREGITAQIVQQIQVDPEYALKAARKFAEKIISEQLNLDKISAISANELKCEQSDNSTNQDTGESDQRQFANSANQNASGSQEKIIDDDWLNSFETEARQKSSTKRMQLLSGHILAGEIKLPGSYSIKTVKMLAQLDQNAALLFKRICSLSTGFMKARSRDIYAVMVFTLENNSLSSHTLDKYGLSFDALSTLQEYGLIASDQDFSYFHVKKSSFLFRHQGRNWVVSPGTQSEDEDKGLDLYGVRFSRFGRELFHIVDQDPMPQYTEDLKAFFAGQKLQMIEFPIT